MVEIASSQVPFWKSSIAYVLAGAPLLFAVAQMQIDRMENLDAKVFFETNFGGGLTTYYDAAADGP